MGKAADIINKLNLGTAKPTIAGDLGSPMNILLVGIHQEVIDSLNKSISKYNTIASNRLKQSIISIDHSVPGKITLEMSAEFYWKYVNYGVNGTEVSHGAPTWGKAPASTGSFKAAILGWIRDKGIQAKPGQTYDQMAFSIMHSIKIKGLRPRPFFTDVVNKELKRYIEKSVSSVIKKAITIEIKTPKY